MWLNAIMEEDTCSALSRDKVDSVRVSTYSEDTMPSYNPSRRTTLSSSAFQPQHPSLLSPRRSSICPQGLFPLSLGSMLSITTARKRKSNTKSYTKLATSEGSASVLSYAMIGFVGVESISFGAFTSKTKMHWTAWNEHSMKTLAFEISSMLSILHNLRNMNLHRHFTVPFYSSRQCAPVLSKSPYGTISLSTT